MNWITEHIAIGNIDDARRLDDLQAAGIAGILSLNGWPNNAANKHGLEWRCIEMIDGAGNEIDRLHAALESLRELLEFGPVLVHCMEGVSRSPLVVASHLASAGGRPFAECLAEVAALRAGVTVQPALIQLRADYEAHLLSADS